MKRNSYTPSSLPFLLLFAFLLLSCSFLSHSASARPLLVLDTAASSQMAGSSDGGETELVSRADQKAAAAAADDHFANSLKEEDFSTLMGAEELENAEGSVCGDKDEDCLARRMVAEAHLDYIYTQNHKNP